MKDTFYNKMLIKTLEMLSDRIIAFSRQDPFDEETWFHHLNKIHKYMNILEINRYIEPKFTLSYGKLVSYYNNKMNLDEVQSTSTHTSNSFIKETRKEICSFIHSGNTNKNRNSSNKVKKKTRQSKKSSRSPNQAKSYKNNKQINNQRINSSIVQENDREQMLSSTVRDEIEMRANQTQNTILAQEIVNDTVDKENENYTTAQLTVDVIEDGAKVMTNDIPAAQTPIAPSAESMQQFIDNNTNSVQDQLNNTTSRIEKSNIKPVISYTKQSPKRYHKYKISNSKQDVLRTSNKSSSRRHGTHMNLRNKSKRKIFKGSSVLKNRVNRTHQQRLNSHDLRHNEFEDNEKTKYEIVPPIHDPNSKVFNTPKHTVLAKSKRIKQKMNISALRGRYPSKKIYYKKGMYTRGNSVNSGRSSSSKRRLKSVGKIRSSSKSSTSSKRSYRRKHNYIKSMGKNNKSKYIRNVLPHIHTNQN